MSNPKITWNVNVFDDLTGREVHEILRLRVDVFIVEQRCVYPEVDGQDLTAIHILGLAEKGDLAAYARILPPEPHGPPHIGRVIVAPAFRGRHLGRHLMHQALREVERRYGTPRSALAAQAYLVDFYGSFGYIPTGDEYLWDGIPHVDMMLDPA